jgi:hypothetical protein
MPPMAPSSSKRALAAHDRSVESRIIGRALSATGVLAGRALSAAGVLASSGDKRLIASGACCNRSGQRHPIYTAVTDEPTSSGFCSQDDCPASAIASVISVNFFWFLKSCAKYA